MSTLIYAFLIATFFVAAALLGSRGLLSHYFGEGLALTALAAVFVLLGIATLHRSHSHHLTVFSIIIGGFLANLTVGYILSKIRLPGDTKSNLHTD